MKTLTLLSGAALLAVAGLALAQDGPAPDRPGPDATITRQQAVARAEQMFARLDANHDGRFTPDEAQAMGEHRRGDVRQHMFDRIDANHDGNISRDEFAQAHAMRDGPGGPGGDRGMEMGPPPGGPGGPEGGHGMHGARMFGDQGFVTLEQMRARALERFDRADANHDGTLTPEERQAAHERMRGGPDEPRRN
jgi:Ca2+-binding EF-hand superfamily protein